jgi:hypothetical protein
MRRKRSAAVTPEPEPDTSPDSGPPAAPTDASPNDPPPSGGQDQPLFPKPTMENVTAGREPPSQKRPPVKE